MSSNPTQRVDVHLSAVVFYCLDRPGNCPVSLHGGPPNVHRPDLRNREKGVTYAFLVSSTPLIITVRCSGVELWPCQRWLESVICERNLHRNHTQPFKDISL